MPTLSYCAQQVRSQDNDRFLCALFAPADRREALFALYAFNLELATIPDKAREPLLGRMRLQWWREALSGGQVAAAGNEVLRALAQALNDTPLTVDSLHHLIDARGQDLEERPILDQAALQRYAANTGGLLGQMALDVLGVADRASREAARHVGIAGAGVGILRAVPFQAARGRMYLPIDSLRAVDLPVDELLAGRSSPAARQVVAGLVDWAHQHLEIARTSRSEVPREALPALLPAVLADMFLARLRRVGFDLFDRRLSRPAPWRVVRLWLAARRGRY